MPLGLQALDHPRDCGVGDFRRKRNAVEMTQRIVACPIEALMGEDQRIIEVHRVDHIEIGQGGEVGERVDALIGGRRVDDRVVRRLPPDGRGKAWTIGGPNGGVSGRHVEHFEEQALGRPIGVATGEHLPERIEQFEGALRRADLQVRDPVARVHVDRYGEAECDEAIDRAVKLREQFAGLRRPDGKALHVHADGAQSLDLSHDEGMRDHRIAACQIRDPHDAEA